MKGVLVDSNIILDVFLNDLKWADWSESKLEEYSVKTSLYINSIIYLSAYNQFSCARSGLWS